MEKLLKSSYFELKTLILNKEDTQTEMAVAANERSQTGTFVMKERKKKNKY